MSPWTRCSGLETRLMSQVTLLWTGLGKYPDRCGANHLITFQLHPKLRLNVTLLYVKTPRYFGTCSVYNVTVAHSPDKGLANEETRTTDTVGNRVRIEEPAYRFAYCGNLAQFSLFPPLNKVTFSVTVHKKMPVQLRVIFMVMAIQIVENFSSPKSNLFTFISAHYFPQTKTLLQTMKVLVNKYQGILLHFRNNIYSLICKGPGFSSRKLVILSTSYGTQINTFQCLVQILFKRPTKMAANRKYHSKRGSYSHPK